MKNSHTGMLVYVPFVPFIGKYLKDHCAIRVDDRQEIYCIGQCIKLGKEVLKGSIQIEREVASSVGRKR